MKKFGCAASRRNRHQLIRELQLLGSVEIGSPEALTEAQQTQLSAQQTAQARTR